MRIVFFVNHFFPSVGGVQWSVLRTAEALAARGHELILVTETKADATSRDEALPFRIMRFHVPLRRPFTRLGYWRWMWGQRKLFASADVLHFHDYTTFFHWFLPLRLLIRRPRYAVTFHGFEHWPIKRRHRLFRSVTAACCDARFAVGDYVRQLYGHPVDAVYLGAPIRSLPRFQRTDQAVFGYVGRLADDTGILPLLTALARAAEESCTAITIRLAGEGPLREKIERLRSPTVEVDMLGVLEDPGQLLASSRWIIATGFLGVFEAFDTGLPVIAPAYDFLKQHYFSSIPDAQEMLTILRDSGGSHAFFSALLAGKLEAVIEQKAVRAREFVSHLAWADIIVLLETWYEKETPEAGRIVSQVKIHETRRQPHVC
ncbi:MAG: glycosyltransferase family 4 protein [Bacteroidetes bacterium]|nr:glycosyltransferase family 4 protein [Bacteroidota bacterium]